MIANITCVSGTPFADLGSRLSGAPKIPTREAEANGVGVAGVLGVEVLASTGEVGWTSRVSSAAEALPGAAVGAHAASASTTAATKGNSAQALWHPTTRVFGDPEHTVMSLLSFIVCLLVADA